MKFLRLAHFGFVPSLSSLVLLKISGPRSCFLVTFVFLLHCIAGVGNIDMGNEMGNNNTSGLKGKASLSNLIFCSF